MSSNPTNRKAISLPGSSPSKVAPTDLPSSGPGSPVPAGASSPPRPTQEGDALTGGHWLQQGLPAARKDDDADSAWSSDAESSTASISSSILHYRIINGRTYHNDSVTDGEYWGPNDQKHLDALEIYHHAVELMLDHKLHMAPIKSDIQRAINIGTGMGLWAIDFADKYPTCEVIGINITPVQPTWLPPNVRFEIEDATKE